MSIFLPNIPIVVSDLNRCVLPMIAMGPLNPTSDVTGNLLLLAQLVGQYCVALSNAPTLRFSGSAGDLLAFIQSSDLTATNQNFVKAITGGGLYSPFA